ncbi:MAG: hypothetical protein B6243_04205 [Anaerolineaceae bacterium 4572_5.2]|nr:MAG: hypothetical protein B6243_04205 [Anaerolineaceae bacterium 4572_5.2]
MPCPLNCRTMMTKWEIFHLLLGKTRFLHWSHQKNKISLFIQTGHLYGHVRNMQHKLMSIEKNSRLASLSRFLWGAVMLTIPVTSFRYFPFLGKSTLVRPLAFYPLTLLFAVLGFRFLRKEIKLSLPGALIPLAGFLLAALLATSIGIFYAPLELRGQEYWARAIRAWVTVFIGVAFFLGAIWMNREESDLRFSLKWLYLGLFATILWGGVQLIAFQTPLLAKETMTHWQRAFSMRELVRANRVSGFAFEPSWLAGQFSTIYLPWLVAALLSGFRISRHKRIEPILAALTAFLLVMTFSRGGILISVAAGALTFILTGRGTLSAIWTWFTSAFQPAGRFWNISLRIGIVILIIVLVVGVVSFLAEREYFNNLIEIPEGGWQEYVVHNFAGARVAYAWGALEAFQSHPWTGVGLGAAGFYIYDNLPDWALTTVPEIARHLSPTTHLYPNAKNLYVRILAELGILGFGLFAAFQLSLLGKIQSTLRAQDDFARFVGVAGLFSWLAILMVSMTQDSFAIPNLWINLGILAGISRTLLAKQKSRE